MNIGRTFNPQLHVFKLGVDVDLNHIVTAKGALEMAKINKAFTPHTLRHSFATHLLEKRVRHPHVAGAFGAFTP